MKQPTVTFKEAAYILNVPVEYLARLINEGKLRRHGMGILLLDDVTMFKADRDKARREALKELARMTDQFGGYDDD